MDPINGVCQEFDWASCTFEGSEREQLRVWSRLPLRRKLMARKKWAIWPARQLNGADQGLPYIVPTTWELMKGRSNSNLEL